MWIKWTLVLYLSYGKALYGLIPDIFEKERKTDWISYSCSWKEYYKSKQCTCSINATPPIDIKNLDVSDFFKDPNDEIGHLIGGGIIGPEDNNWVLFKDFFF